MILIEPSAALASSIDERLRVMPDYWRPVWLAVRDHGCACAIIVQGDGEFVVPVRHPVIALIGDDLAEAKGPEAFDRTSLERLLKRCKGVVIVSSAATIEAYGAAVATAVGLRADVAIIETKPNREAEWLAFVEKHAPDAAVLVSTECPEAIH